METKVIVSEPVFVLGSGPNKVEVYESDLLQAEVGTSWGFDEQDGYSKEQSELVVVFKNEDGLALVEQYAYTSGEYSSTPRDYDPVLYWYQYPHKRI